MAESPKSCLNISVWAMNGQPIPSKIQRRLEGAVQAITKDVDERVRLLHTLTWE